MTTTTASAALIPAAPVFTNTERLALAGFLAGYSGLTRQAYELDLRQYTSWCQQHHLRLFQARRADIECFARDLEARGRARATITRRLCIIAGFYRSAAASPTAPGSRRAAGRCRVRPTFTAVPMFPGTDRGAFGSARSRSSIRYGIATPVARPIATPVSRRPISSPGRAFHAATSPHHTFIPPSTTIWTPVM
jgi:Phage integrase, N-terminal SAM-like domain